MEGDEYYEEIEQDQFEDVDVYDCDENGDPVPESQISMSSRKSIARNPIPRQVIDDCGRSSPTRGEISQSELGLDLNYQFHSDAQIPSLSRTSKRVTNQAAQSSYEASYRRY